MKLLIAICSPPDERYPDFTQRLAKHLLFSDSCVPVFSVTVGQPEGLLRRLGAHLDTESIIFNVVRFPELNLVSFNIQYMNEFSVTVTFDGVKNCDTFFFQFRDKPLQVGNAIIDHEILFRRIEIVRRLFKRSPLRKPFPGGIRGLSPLKDCSILVGVQSKVSFVPYPHGVGVLAFEKDPPDARHSLHCGIAG